MIRSNLAKFKRGWIVGNFDPSLYKADYEVGIHRYFTGDKSEAHYHKETEEINIVVKGKCKFTFKHNSADVEYTLKEGDVLVVERLEVVQFEALKNCTLVVLKPKSIPHDKYPWKPVSDS